MQRISYLEFPAGITEGLYKTEMAIKKSGLDKKIIELIKLRASLLNGCAYCIDMHFKEAKHMGEEELRLYSVSVWRECSFYTDREKAALLFTEVLTNINQEEVSDEVFAEVSKHFNNAEIAILTVAIGQINIWNRINKAIKATPGNYVVGQYN